MPTSASEKSDRKARSSYKLERTPKLNSFTFTIFERLDGVAKAQAMQLAGSRVPAGAKDFEIVVWKKLSEHPNHAAAKAELARLEGEPS